MGRADELGAMTALVDDALSGRSSALLLVGEAGVGKTVLLDELALAAQARGAAVIPVVALPTESGIPGAMLDVVSRELSRLPDGSALVRALAGPSPSGLLHALARLDRPALLVADDVHWWDAASRAALVFAARRLADDPVAIVAAGRPEALGDVGLASLPRLDIGPVDLALAPELAASVAPGTAASVAHDVWTGVGGNTLAFVEVMVRLDAQQRAGRAPLPDALPVGPGVVERWAGDIASLPESTRRTLVALAVTTDEDPIAALMRALGADSSDLESAEAAGLVVVRGGRPGFRHPLVRSAVLAAVEPATVREAHRAAAQVLGRAAPSVHRVHRRARHRAAAALGPDVRVARLLRDDADWLAGQQAALSAADVLGLAAQSEPDDAQAAEDLCRAAWLAIEDFDDDLAARLGRLGLAREPGDGLRGRLLRVTGLATSRVVDAPEGCRMIAEGIPLLEGEERREAVRDLLFALDLTEQRDSQALPLIEELGPLEDLPIIDRLLVAHSVVVICGTSADRFGRLLGSVTVQEATSTGWATEVVTNAGLDVGLDISAPKLRTIAESLASSGDPRRRLDGLGIDLLVAFWEGRWDELEDEADETAELCAALGRADLYSEGIRLSVLARRGDEHGFLRSLRRAEDVMGGAGMEFWLGSFVGERAALERALGRDDVALRLLETVPFASMVRVVPHTVYADHLLALVELLADSGRHDDAVATRDLMRRLLVPGPSLLGQGLLARADAAVAPDRDVEDLLCQAERQIAGGVHVFELAMARLRYARWLRRHRRRQAAVELLRAAAASCLRLGCGTWVAVCEGELAAAGAGAERIDRYDATGALTAQERRVADAVAEGLTNEEVARRLFLSPRTVEVHLTHVYRKLDLRGRSELVRRLAERSQA